MGDVACPSCGTVNPEAAENCRSCGAELDAPAPTAAASRRVVTILFSDITGSTSMGEQLDPETLRWVLSRYFTEMHAVLERHGARVEKYIGDAVMAVFGIPQAHEDDALRAVRAAAEMRDALRELNTELRERNGVTLITRTGLNTGEVLAAEATEQQSLVVADAVNVAARLEQAAEPGEVLLGDPTFRLVRDAVEVAAVEPLSVKGKSAPLTAWRLLEVLPVASGWERRLDSPLVGRAPELAQLLEAYARTRGSATSTVVTVLGGAGVGKTRLGDEFVRSVSEGAQVALGHCLSYGQGITFNPIIQVIRSLLDVSDSDPPSAVRARLERLLGGAADGPMVIERVATLTGDGDARLSVQETFWAVRRLFEELATTRPLVVLIDDIQWAEPTMLDLLEYLADRLGSARVLLVLLARSELLDGRPGWLSGRPNATLLDLDPLPDGAIAELIDNLLEGTELAADAGARIVALAEGNPLFVEETLRMLLDDDVLQLVAGRWTVVGDISVTIIPPTIHALITARLDRLDPDDRAVLERASVVGRSFWWGAVTELAPPDLVGGVGRALQSLTRKQLVRPGRSDLPGEDALEFTHNLVRDATYAGIPKELRADLHERLAVWLERRHSAWTEAHEETVGYHLERVHTTIRELGLPPARVERVGRRAAELLAASGRRALTRGDMPAAVNLLSRATSLFPGSEPVRFDVLPRLAFALMETGDFERLSTVVAELGEAASASGDQRLVAHATTLELYIRLFTSPTSWADEAEREALDAIDTFQQVGDEHGLAKAWSLLGLVNVWTGRFRRAQEAWERAASHAATAGEWRDELEASSWVLLTMWAGPTPVVDGLRRSHEILERAGTNHKGRASAMFMRATFEAALGRVDTARELIEQARGLLDEVALTVWKAGPLTQMAGFIELGAGQPEAAERQLRWGYEELRQVGEVAWLPTLASLLAQAVYAQGRDDEAEALVDRARDLAGDEDVVSQILWRRVLAGVRARGGRAAEAESLSLEALDLAQATDSLPLQGVALLGRAEVLDQLGRAAESELAAEEAVATFERKGMRGTHHGSSLVARPTP